MNEIGVALNLLNAFYFRWFGCHGKHSDVILPGATGQMERVVDKNHTNIRNSPEADFLFGNFIKSHISMDAFAMISFDTRSKDIESNRLHKTNSHFL